MSCHVRGDSTCCKKEVNKIDPTFNIMERLAKFRNDTFNTLAHNMSYVVSDGSHLKCADNETGDREVFLALPGIDKKNVSVSTVGRVLTISYEQHDNTDSRVFVNTGKIDLNVSKDFDLNNVDALFENGVLKITIKRIEEKTEKPTTIKIK